MKDTILVPVMYLLVLILCALVLGLGTLFFTGLAGYDPAVGIQGKTLLKGFFGFLPVLFPVMVSFTVLVLSLRIDRRHRLRFISQLLLAVSGFLSLYLFYGFLPSPGRTGQEEQQIAPVVVTDQITVLEDRIFYLQEYDPPMLQGLFIKDISKENEPFQYYSAAFLEDSAIKDRAGKTLIAYSVPNPVYYSLYAPPTGVKGLFQDIQLTSERFKAASEDAAISSFFVFAAGILFCLALRIAAGITRWPLINVCLALSLYRGYFFIYRVATNRDVLASLQTAFSDDLILLLPEILLLVPAAVLFLLRLLTSAGKRSAGKAAL